MPAGSVSADAFKARLAPHQPWKAVRCQAPSTALRAKLVSGRETGRLRGATFVSVVEATDLGVLSTSIEIDVKTESH